MELEARSEAGWQQNLAKCLSGATPIHLVGVGNPIGRDDSVGLHVISALRHRLGARPRPNVRIHQPALDPERTLANLGGKMESVVIFDAVECNRDPGHIFCAKLSDSRFGFFATHNVPLKLIPGFEASLADAWIVGVQPDDTGVGEDMTEIVRHSAELLVESVEKLLEGGRRGPA